MKRLQDKVAVITGGGSGIGAATAALFVQEGARVVVVGRNEEKLRKTMQAINHENVSYTVADVSQVEDTQRYLRETVERHGGLDIVVSNAGIQGEFGPISDISVEAFDSVMAINVRGTWLAIKYAFPELRKRGGGSIILTASAGGLNGMGISSPYVASKHAVVGLARAGAIDGAPHGIRVNAVCPGPVDNDMMTNVERTLGAGNEAQVRAWVAGRVPLKRFGSNEEVAKLNLFLASGDSSYCTGGTYTVDGGWSASLP
ncbi:glucose 1-dehydrogenase [Pyxidicoccus fallax]|uniref:Glucose 1-dehydrogenase n=1 Tax=Pyxidicoccus fallax TaxID=394095 RepID=A0A848LFD0_9BACT|nr:glucose 1-dehydrogenase [Pyxidicoccus fallax]NMO15713.1 glucose 1-dehydrogenase [Pyxidicoccus fallax]NPC77120.1 glucose 1-dehydrogenase [Pyxidicoccus fallax]